MGFSLGIGLGLTHRRGGGVATPSFSGSTPVVLSQTQLTAWRSPLTDQSVPAAAVGAVNVASGSTTTARSGVSPLGVWATVDVAVTTFSGSDTEDSVYCGLIGTTAKVVGGLDKDAGKAFIEVTTTGGATTRVNATPSITVADGDILRVILIGGVGTGGTPNDGCWVQVFRSQDSGSTWTYLTDRFCDEVDVRTITTLADLEYGYAARATHSGGGTRSFTLGNFEAGYYGESGHQNVQAVTTEDGRPVRHADGRYYLSYTMGGRNGPIPGEESINLDYVSFIAAAVGLYDPATNGLTQTALHFFEDGTRAIPHTPASYSRHRAGSGSPYAGEWVILASPWASQNASKVFASSLLATPAEGTDILSGVHVLATTTVTHPELDKSYDWSQAAWVDGEIKVSYTGTVGTVPGVWTHYPVFASGADLASLSSLGVDWGFGYQAEGMRVYKPAGGIRFVGAGSDGYWREYLTTGRLVGGADRPFAAEIASHLQPLGTVAGVLRGVTSDTTRLNGMPWSHGRFIDVSLAGGSAAVPDLTLATDEAGLTPMGWVRAGVGEFYADLFGYELAEPAALCTVWRDITGRPGPSRGLVKTTEAEKPSVGTGSAWLDCSAAGRFLAGTMPAAGNSLWCIAVVRYSGGGTFPRVCSVMRTSSNDFGNANGAVLIYADSGSWKSYHNGAELGTVAATTGSDVVVDALFDGGQHEIRENGGTAGTASLPGGFDLDADLWAVGWAGEGNNPFPGRIYEIRLYFPAPSLADRATIRDALMADYGIT